MMETIKKELSDAHRSHRHSEESYFESKKTVEANIETFKKELQNRLDAGTMNLREGKTYTKVEYHTYACITVTNKKVTSVEMIAVHGIEELQIVADKNEVF